MNNGAVADVLARIKIHDVDSHVSEPPDLWTTRVSSKWGDDVPHVITDRESGVQSWYIRDVLVAGVGSQAMAGWRGESSHPPSLEEAAPGTWQAKPRLEWMDEHGIFSQVVYPNILGFIPPVFFQLDEALRLELVRAYNDFQTEFCSEAPDRLLPMAYLPWWDREACAVELARCVELGHKGVLFAWEFERHGFPPLRSTSWEPLLRMIEEAGLPVSFHVGFGGSAAMDEFKAVAATDDRLAVLGNAAKVLLGNADLIIELIMGQVCHRHPNLKFVSVESGMGYVPYLLDGLDWHIKKSSSIRKAYQHFELPSEYFRRQIYGTFWFEADVPYLVDLYPNNFMFETDYPHGTSLSPDERIGYGGPQETIVQNLGSMPEDLLVKVLQDNAAAVYGLPS